MELSEMLHLSEQNRDLLWDSFKYEQILEDTEDDLYKDLEYYNKKLKLLGEPETSLDLGIAAVYKAHISSINRLLNVIHRIKTNPNDGSKQLSIFQTDI